MIWASMSGKICLPARTGSWSVRTHGAIFPERLVGSRSGTGPRTLPDLAPLPGRRDPPGSGGTRPWPRLAHRPPLGRPVPAPGAGRAGPQGAQRQGADAVLRHPAAGHRGPRPAEATAVRGGHPSPGGHPRRAARGVPAELWVRLCADPPVGSGPHDPGPRGVEGLCRRLRPGPSPRGDRTQCRLAGRPYGTRHPAG